MKLIYGTTAARKRAKEGKEGRVRKRLFSQHFTFVFFFCEYFWSNKSLDFNFIPL